MSGPLREQVQALAAQGRLDEALAVARAAEEGEAGEASFLQGVLLGRLGRHAEAEAALRRALSLEPGRAEAWFCLGRALEALGRTEEAAVAFRRAGEHSDKPEPWRRAARLFQALGHPAEAITALQGLLRRAPGDLATRLRLTELLQRAGCHAEAAAHFQALAAMLPEHWEPRYLLGAAWLNCGLPERALPPLEEAIRLGAGRPEPAAEAVKALHMLGRSGEAAQRLAPLLARHPDDFHVLTAYAELAPALGREEDAAARLDAALARAEPPARLRALARFQLASLLDRLGREPDRVLELLAAAHRLAGHRFDREAHAARLAWTLRAFSVETMARLPRRRAGDLGEGLVFVVGLPRTGTTLIESLLDAHPRAHGGGERDGLGALGRALRAEAGNRPLDQVLSSERLDAMARSYLEPLRREARGAEVVVDKMPTNFWWLGLAALLFPRARVVHARRHPLDTCLSCHLAYLSAAHGYTGRLEDTALYYRDHLRLMARWRDLLPVLELRYEELVAHPEEQLRRLLDFVGLPWDPACLRFHERGRLARTASYDQVRRPLYRGAAGRWRRYLDAPPMAALHRDLAELLDESLPGGYR
ncbi:MAG: sulfotransferase family protein [Gammaproteobacteria bacterium]|nr:MAG: sulfotransferase family protein [Gammaproteobacteria bacterium]